MVNALLGTSAGGRPEDRLGQELRFQVRIRSWHNASLANNWGDLGLGLVDLVNLVPGHQPVWC